MLRRFGNAIFAAALLAVASSEYLTAVRADAYANSVYGDSVDAVTETPVDLDVPRSGSSADDAVITPPAGSLVNVEEEAVTATPSTPVPAATVDDSSSDLSTSSGPTITVEEEPVTTAPKATSSPSGSSSHSGPTITVEEEPVIVGSEEDVVGADADRSGDASPTPATTSTKTTIAASPAATPAATTAKTAIAASPAATPAATTTKTAAVVSPAATPAASTVKPAAVAGSDATAATPVPAASTTPTVVPAKKRKDCDPQFPAEDSSAAATPAPSAPKTDATPAPTPAKTTAAIAATPAPESNGSVKVATGSVSDSDATSFVQREAPSATPAAAVVNTTTKSDEGNAGTASTSLFVPVAAAAAVAAVMGVAAFNIKKKRDEAKLSTPREQNAEFGEVRATPAGNAVL